MSNNALFVSNANRGINKNLVEFKAGKMTMRGKMVYPDNRKGQLYVYQSEDSLIHFCWKDRSTGAVEDDLIIFPEDCEFKHVSQCNTGRVYLLKFKSSNRKFFFWLQDLITDKDEEYCRKINEVLNNPPTAILQRSSGTNPEGDLQNLLNNMSQQQLMQLFGNVGHIGGLGNLLGNMNRSFSGNSISSDIEPPGISPPMSANRSPHQNEPKTSKSTGNTASTPSTISIEASTADNNRVRLSDLQSFLSGIPTDSGTESMLQKDVVTELSSAIPAAIFVSENLENIVEAHLPVGDSLSTTLSSPQFSQALSMFWTALQSGQAAPMVKQFGLGPDVIGAATYGNVEQFLQALETETKGEIHNEIKEITPIASKDQEKMATQQSMFENLTQKEGNNDKEDDDDEGMALD